MSSLVFQRPKVQIRIVAPILRSSDFATYPLPVNIDKLDGVAVLEAATVLDELGVRS